MLEEENKRLSERIEKVYEFMISERVRDVGRGKLYLIYLLYDSRIRFK